jgi:hypothetical protein
MQKAKNRLDDFETRASIGTGCCEVVKHMKTGDRYIPIHPFADDDELLVKLGLKPGDCLAGDAYWHMGDDICFLQVLASNTRKISFVSIRLMPGLVPIMTLGVSCIYLYRQRR